MADDNNLPELTELPSEAETPLADPRDEEIAALRDRMLRLAAEMENLRKRAEREKAEATLYAATNFARDLLSVADNMGRALSAVSQDERDRADAVTKNLLAGVEVVERELLNTFQRYGIRRLVTVGEKFDPNMHQALFEVPTNERPPGTVMQEVQSGFAIGDRCLRPAMVGVAKAEA